MNLNQSPSKAQLKSLLAAADDSAGHHILWVDKAGEVHLDLLPEDLSPIGFENAKQEDMQFRLETLQVENGYTGSDAAADQNWIDELYDGLTSHWTAKSTGYIDDLKAI